MMPNCLPQSVLYILVILCGCAQTYAQKGETVNQVVVVNGGKFEFTPPFQDYVTLEAYDPDTKLIRFFDTIFTQSCQDIVISNHFAYVAAQDSIVKYNLDTYQRVGAIADSGLSKLCLVENKLIVSKQSPVERFFVEILDENLALLAFVDGISGDCAGITYDNDSLYVAVNNGWEGTEGRLAVISKKTWNLVRERNFGSDAVGISNVYNYGGKVFTVNKTPFGFPAEGSISALNLYSGVFTNQVLSYTVGDASGIDENLLYLKLNEGIGSFNLDSQTIEDSQIVPDPGSIAHKYILSSCVDYVNDRLYLNIGNKAGNGMGVVTTITGDSITSFAEGINADCIAVDYRIPVNLGEITDFNLSLFPNPVHDKLYIHFSIRLDDMVQITVNDLYGHKMVDHLLSVSDHTISMDVGFLPTGFFLVRCVTNGKVKTKKFWKE